MSDGKRRVGARPGTALPRYRADRFGKARRLTMNVYGGSCHCSAIKVALRTSKTGAELGARSCQCSFCRAHGASWTSDPTGALEIEITGPVSRYRFGTGTAEFLICATCGVVPAVIYQDDERLLGVVRVDCLRNETRFSPTPRQPTSTAKVWTSASLGARRSGRQRRCGQARSLEPRCRVHQRLHGAEGAVNEAQPGGVTGGLPASRAGCGATAAAAGQGGWSCSPALMACPAAPVRRIVLRAG